MDEMRRLDDARRKLTRAEKDKGTAEANLKSAGIQAHADLKARKKSLTQSAREANLSPPMLSRLATEPWKAHGRSIYEAIDGITEGRYRLAQLRDEFDTAEKAVQKARTAVKVADAAAEAAGGGAAQNTSYAATHADELLIDDVLVDRQADRVILDIRLRNPGTRLVNVTRAAVRVLKRGKFLAAYPSTADYDLLIESDYNEAKVSHYLKADEVDRFSLTLGFAPSQQGVLFTAEVVLRFNGDSTAVSKPITFDSCFG